MKIKLDDFEIGKLYGFQTNYGRVVGSVLLKARLETEVGNEEQLLKLYIGEDEQGVELNIKDIENYWSYEVDENNNVKEIKVYDEELQKYGVQSGHRITEILKMYIDKWQEYDVDTKQLLANKINHLMTTDVFVDLLSGLVDYKKYFDEEHQKYMSILEKQANFLKKYMEFKETVPFGLGKVYDVLLFDVCELDLS